MTRIAFALAALLALPLGLGGCKAIQNLTTVSDAQTAADKTATAVTTIQSSSATNLTKAQAASCAGEALANTLTDMLTSTGHLNAAKISADVSTALGDGCTWKLPAL
jgi:Flp pilus assembly protein TadG